VRCPYCSHLKDKVIDSRAANEGKSVRRRRECLKCKRRFTTYESVEEISMMVVKRDGRRESFDRNKIISGILKACEKRPVSLQKVEDLVDRVERELYRKYEKEVPIERVGELVMDRLSKIDEVAYVRFASVYRHFKDINQFMRELKDLLK
jgi:transcriptional repressor NrdR